MLLLVQTVPFVLHRLFSFLRELFDEPLADLYSEHRKGQYQVYQAVDTFKGAHCHLQLLITGFRQVQLQ